MQQLFEVENKNTDRNSQRKLYDLKKFKPPKSVLRYISKNYLPNVLRYKYK